MFFYENLEAAISARTTPRLYERGWAVKIRPVPTEVEGVDTFLKTIPYAFFDRSAAGYVLRFWVREECRFSLNSIFDGG